MTEKKVEERSRSLNECAEGFNEEFGMHLRHFQYNEQIQAAGAMGSGYAQMAMKSLVLMNGGALVALPAIVGTFNIKSRDMDHVLWAAGFHALGLFSIILAMILAYYSIMKSIGALVSSRQSKHDFYFGVYYGNFFSKGDLMEHNAAVIENKENASQLERSSSRIELAATVAVTFSLVMFLLGAFFLLKSF